MDPWRDPGLLGAYRSLDERVAAVQMGGGGQAAVGAVGRGALLRGGRWTVGKREGRMRRMLPSFVCVHASI